MRTYIIGRSPNADIVLADPSVARRHAELVVADDGRLFLTDCDSDSGSWRAGDGAESPEWQALRQGFVTPDQPLRLGECRCNAQQLLQMAGADGHEQGAGILGPRNEPAGVAHGAVERDPHTGEIIRRRP